MKSKPASFVAAILRLAVSVATAICMVLSWPTDQNVRADEKVVKIVVFGDVLSSGYYLPAGRRFPDRLEFALKAKGQMVTVVNASVSSDTAARGLARLNRAVPDDTDAVILEFGAIDMLWGTEPDVTRTSIEAILQNLRARHIAVLLCGARPHVKLDDEHGKAFAAIFSGLAREYDVLFYPAFDDAFADEPQLKEIGDFKPNSAGTEAVVTHMLPKVEALIDQARQRPLTSGSGR
ncbi:GDSL-type esterase/lipase family protein [Bradyrhizobium cajani]|uniref:Lysophospholipase n=1 Tax=Bradyrhizobium cajani TaxID=1928661 RepID=A0A844TPJ3_9BRAD|nr:GDSL-type esterase/lipase family protein [Bradyrhizobium cajani]MCP3370443.1 GDSL-type esterase/lipase family protein [Bradyrhizobium cajani]MVT77734.1 lysophospholipase [Bradyrhizobium cajani]